MFTYVKNQTSYPLVFLMISNVDHISPATGLNPVVTLSKNGADFFTSAGAVSEIGNGWYQVIPNGIDFNTLGPLLLHATNTLADPTDAEFFITDGAATLSTAQFDSLLCNIQSLLCQYCGGR